MEFVCTVETVLIIVGNANHERLRDTGNFVVTDSAVISAVSERGMWRLQCPSPKRTLPSKELQKIKEESELRCCRFYLPENTKFLSVNGFELGEQWLDRIDEYQLQSLPKTVVTDNDLAQFVTLWYDLISDEKTRQRVCKGRDYAFADEGLNLPWKFVEPQGFLTLPIIVWMKKIDIPKSNSPWTEWTETRQDGWTDWPAVRWHTGRGEGSSSASYP